MQFIGSENKFPLILGRLVELEHQKNYSEEKRFDFFVKGFLFQVW